MAYKPGHHPNSRKALKPVKKGEVRNPEGRNQWTTIRGLAIKMLSENFEALASKAMEMALAGDVTLLKFLLSSGFDVKAFQVLDQDGQAQSFAELARMARDTTGCDTEESDG